MFRVYIRNIHDAYVKDSDILDFCVKVEMVMPGQLTDLVSIRCYTVSGDVINYSGPYDLIVTEGANYHAETDN